MSEQLRIIGQEQFGRNELKRRLTGLIIVLCLSLPMTALAAVDGVEILQYGIFAVTGHQVIDQRTSPAGQRALVKSGDVTVIEPTDRVPAVVGTKFGFEFIIKGNPKGNIVTITRKTICPGLTNPSTGQYNTEWTSPPLNNLKIGDRYPVGYSFDKEWELVPGKWTIQLIYEGKVVAEKTFVVYKP